MSGFAAEHGFAVELDTIDPAAVLARIDSATADNVTRVISQARHFQPLGPEDLLVLVSPAAAALLEPMAQAAQVITARRFGHTISLYAPLYVSNYCANTCVYCGFNAHNQVARRVLGITEVIEEAKVLKGRHISQLLVVTGESPRHCGAGDLATMARQLKPMFPSLAIEVQPMDTQEYRALQQAGVDGLAVYQETYERGIYAQVHPAGPKRDFDYRLSALERGGEAGFRQLVIGSLLGLNDWRLEAYYVARHAAYLMKHYWKSQVSVSFPRLRPAAGGFQPPHPVSEQDLARMIFALRLALPDAGLVLSTREPAAFRDNMMGLGVTRISAGSKTSPGGYLDELGDQAEGQFAVCDERSVEDVVAAVRGRGFDPVWKDWDAGFEQSAGVDGDRSKAL
jgi:2-iminoacetate synthase